MMPYMTNKKSAIMKRFFFLLFFSFSAFYSYGQSGYWHISKDSLRIMIQTVKEDTIKINLLTDLGSKYPWSYPDTALQYGNQALALAEKLKYKKGIYNARNVIIHALTTMGNYPLALEYSLKNDELSQTFNDPESKVASMRSLAENYLRTGEFNNWLVYMNKALALARKSKLAFEEHLMLDYIAKVYLERNQPDSALYYATGSYRLINNWPGQPIDIGHAYLQKNMFDSAVHWFKIGLFLADSNQTEQDFVDVDNLMALLHKKKNNIDSAIWYSKKALSEKLSASYPLGTLKAANFLVSLYESQSKPDSAFRYLRMSITLKDSLFSREKTIAEQTLLYNKQEKEKELAASRLKLRNQLKLYLLLGGVLALLIIAYVLFRANQHKQRSFIQLQKQKDEIEIHKTLAEQSLNELKTTQAQLIQSEKMASLGELTAGIAHEIQNPLNFVNNFSEVNKELIDEMEQEMDKGNLKGAKGIAKNIRENEEKINQHGRRADAIVKGMLQHSRTSSGQKKPTDINALADEYLRLAYHGLRAKDNSFTATIKTDFDQSIGNLNIIPQDIGRAILNLLTNAFYAASLSSREKTGLNSGGSSGSEKRNDPIVWVSTKKMGDKVLISVRDNGPGIPQKLLDKIFQPFFTTKPTGQGTGLGLSLSYDIVKAHGGELKVKTSEGQGSEFTIQLPVN
jgi:two-component system NtrC family sensor kinase